MSVQEVSELHQEYLDASNRFRAAWTFHQFAQSLNKIFFEEVESQQPAAFQEVYSQLKQVSASLNNAGAEQARETLTEVETKLANLTSGLLEQDSRISPASLRRFFQRVKNTDDKILAQLVRFYLYSYEGPGWSDDRIDKLDFLVTRMATASSPGGDDYAPSDREKLREILQGLWRALGVAPSSGEAVRAHRKACEELRTEVEQISDLDQLQGSGLVARYRQLKHEMGDLFFEPDVLLSIIDTNIAVGHRVRELYRTEESSIVAEFQQIFDLEREVPVSIQLDEELTNFRRQVELFESDLEGDELKLGQLAHIRRQVRSLIPRLTEISDRRRVSVGEVEDPLALADVEPISVSRPEPPAPPAELLSEADELVEATKGRLLEALQDSDASEDPAMVALKPGIFHFRLEPREVRAFHHLAAEEGDAGHEGFLLEAAALRYVVNEQAEVLRSVLDDTSLTGESPAFDRARGVLRRSDLLLRQFDHALDQAVLGGQSTEARELQVLRMRFVRDHAGLWLLAHKPRRAGFSSVSAVS